MKASSGPNRSGPKKHLLPEIEVSDKPILFCFPWAGGGTTVYRSWREPLSDLVQTVPIRLPARESRINEPPFTTMEELVEAVTEELAPYLRRPFLFYGHSMGAGAAFAVTLKLRSRSLDLPKRLVLASARAPQLRTEPPRSHPTDAELIEQIRKLNSLPDNPEIIELTLPALRADTRLYRSWIYQPEPPLDMPIHALHGVEDSALTAEQVSAWSAQTTAGFAFYELPGGHVFPRSHPKETLEAIRKCLLF